MSLAQLLHATHGVRNHLALPHLTHELVLGWADAHHARTGDWPDREAGAVVGVPGETWAALDKALSGGHRGLTEGSSLIRLLAEHRGVRNPAALPRLETWEILVYADAHFDRAGRWPTADSGPIDAAAGESWSTVDTALREGLRGLPGGDSLARLLERPRGARNLATLPALSVNQIRVWVEAHFRRTGTWPRRSSGPIPEAPGETWSVVYHALHRGLRGLPEGNSLTRLVRECQEVNRRAPSP